MHYYVKHHDDAAMMNGFLRKLERLAAYMRATSYDVTHRIERYAKVLEDIDACTTGTKFGTAIELTAEEISKFISELNSNMYTMTAKKRNYLILRLDSFVSNCAATYDSRIFTVEHVLPQTVAPKSQWETWWPDEDERKEWVHKIGNLLPLAKRTNSEAQNYDFDKKKDKYFRGKSGVTAYALTTQVISESEWKPETVKRRQSELIEVYKKNWNLL